MIIYVENIMEYAKLLEPITKLAKLKDRRSLYNKTKIFLYASGKPLKNNF